MFNYFVIFQLAYFDVVKVPKWYCSNDGAAANPMTQVIWAQSTKVGCGFISYAESMQYEKVK